MRRKSAPVATTTTMTLDGQEWEVPIEVADLNVREPGAARIWIEAQVEERDADVAAAQRRVDSAADKEFTAITEKLAKIDKFEKRLELQELTIDAYESANNALKLQLDALEESGAAGSAANATARKAAYDLSTAATQAAAMVVEIARQSDNAKLVVGNAQSELRHAQEEINTTAQQAVEAGKTRMELEQQVANRLLDEIKSLRAEVASASASASAAEAEAKAAFETAKSASVLTKDSITPSAVADIAREQLQQISPLLLEQALEKLREEMPHGPGGPRMDPGFIENQTKGFGDQGSGS